MLRGFHPDSSKWRVSSQPCAKLWTLYRARSKLQQLIRQLQQQLHLSRTPSSNPIMPQSARCLLINRGTLCWLVIQLGFENPTPEYFGDFMQIWKIFNHPETACPHLYWVTQSKKGLEHCPSSISVQFFSKDVVLTGC